MTNPAGFISLAKDYLRDSLANCATWQSWVGASGTGAADVAVARIYDEALPPSTSGNQHTLAELKAARPFALLTTESAGLSVTAAPVTTSDYGVLTLIIYDNVPPDIERDDGEIAVRFENKLGAIMYELSQNRDTASYLALDNIELQHWGRTPKNELAMYGDAVQAVLRVEWSARQ